MSLFLKLWLKIHKIYYTEKLGITFFYLNKKHFYNNFEDYFYRVVTENLAVYKTKYIIHKIKSLKKSSYEISSL